MTLDDVSVKKGLFLRVEVRPRELKRKGESKRPRRRNPKRVNEVGVKAAFKFPYVFQLDTNNAFEIFGTTLFQISRLQWSLQHSPACKNRLPVKGSRGRACTWLWTWHSLTGSLCLFRDLSLKFSTHQEGRVVAPERRAPAMSVSAVFAFKIKMDSIWHGFSGLKPLWAE